MIARLEGLLRERTPDRAVIDVCGVGYEVSIPLSTFTELPDAGKTVALHVYTHVREGAIQLFGFHTPVERRAFELLLRANRVGPRLAQTVLSGITPAGLLDSIRSGDTGPLCSVPGVGARVAERILVELRDRTDALAEALAQSGDAPAHHRVRDAGDDTAPETSDARQQALSALLNLGYPKPHAERVLEAAAADAGTDAPLEDWIRAALKRLAR